MASSTFAYYYETLGMTDSEIEEFEIELWAYNTRQDDDINLEIGVVCDDVREVEIFEANHDFFMVIENCL